MCLKEDRWREVADQHCKSLDITDDSDKFFYGRDSSALVITRGLLATRERQGAVEERNAEAENEADDQVLHFHCLISCERAL